MPAAPANDIFRFPFSWVDLVPAVGVKQDDLTGEVHGLTWDAVIPLLEDRDRALEDFVDHADVVFSQPGALAVLTSPRYYPRTNLLLRGFAAGLDTAGTSNTVVNLLMNGSPVATLTLGSGVHYLPTPIAPAVQVVARTDYIQAQVTAVGTGAKDLTATAER